MIVRDLPTNTYTSPLACSRPTFRTCPQHTIHAHEHISRMLRHNYTVVLIQIEHNFLLGTKVNSENEIEKAACFGWLRYFKAIRLVSDGYSGSPDKPGGLGI